MTVAVRSEVCPHCGVSLIGEPIPDRYRHHNTPDSPYFDPMEPTHDEQVATSGRCFCLPYGGATHFRREIAREDRDLDAGVEFICPDCGGRWSR
jgi:predicted RNA-binding Zn-ribbon protein involved in translation (DUF1610 family)